MENNGNSNSTFDYVNCGINVFCTLVCLAVLRIVSNIKKEFMENNDHFKNIQEPIYEYIDSMKAKTRFSKCISCCNLNCFKKQDLTPHVSDNCLYESTLRPAKGPPNKKELTNRLSNVNRNEPGDCFETKNFVSKFQRHSVRSMQDEHGYECIPSSFGIKSKSLENISEETKSVSNSNFVNELKNKVDKKNNSKL